MLDANMNIKNLILNMLILLAFVIGFSFIAKYIIEQEIVSLAFLNPESRAINSFIELVNKNDYGGLSMTGALETSNGLVSFNEKNSSLVAFSMNNNLFRVHPDMDANTYLETLKEKGFLTIKDKTLIFKPISIEVQTNLAETVLIFNEIPYCETDKNTLSAIVNNIPPFPISIEVVPNHQEFLGSEKVWIHPFQVNNSNRHSVDVQLTTRFISASSTAENAMLYVNDFPTSLEISTYIGLIGPLCLEFDTNTLYTKKTYPWGDFQSQPVMIPFSEVGKTYSFHLDPVNDTLKSSIYDTVHQLNIEYSEAFNHLNTNFFTTLTEKRLEYVRNQIQENFIGLNNYIELNLEYYTIIEESFVFIEDDDQYKVNLDVKECYWESKWHSTQNKPTLRKNKPQTSQYTLIYDSDLQKWLIDDWKTY